MLKEFIKYFKESKEYRREQIFAVLFSVAVSAVSAIAPFLIRSIIRDIQAGIFSQSTLVNFIAIFLVLIVVRCVSFFSNNLNSKMGSVIGHNKRYNVLNRILKAKIHRKKILDLKAKRI